MWQNPQKKYQNTRWAKQISGETWSFEKLNSDLHQTVSETTRYYAFFAAKKKLKEVHLFTAITAIFLPNEFGSLSQFFCSNHFHNLLAS